MNRSFLKPVGEGRRPSLLEKAGLGLKARLVGTQRSCGGLSKELWPSVQGQLLQSLALYEKLSPTRHGDTYL